jgi:ABC-type sugar transport system permease subunit
MEKITTSRAPVRAVPAESFIETLISALQRAVNADTMTFAFAVALLLSFFTGTWLRISEQIGLTGYTLLTDSSAAAEILSSGTRIMLAVIPLAGAAAATAIVSGLLNTGMRRHIPLIASLCGIAALVCCLLYAVDLARDPHLVRHLDVGFWFGVGAAIALVVQYFLNRGTPIQKPIGFALITVTTVLNAALWATVLIAEVARSRLGESVAFEITGLVGLMLYGGLMGMYHTGIIFSRRGHRAWWGRIIGLFVGGFGNLVLLIPLWLNIPNSAGVQNKRIKIDEITWGMAFLAPWLIGFILLTVYPMMDSYRVALYNWSGFGKATQYVGLRHIESVMRDPIFWRSFANTVVYTAVLVPIQLALALLLALLLNRPRMRFAVVYRTIYFLPVVTSVAVVAVVVRLLVQNFGTNISEFLGFDPPINPITSPQLALPTVIAFGIWHSFGVNLVYFLAALQTVPQELYDAAKVDGANWFQEVRHVTLPGIRPIAIVVLFMAIIGSMNVFEQSFVLTRGGPFFASQVVSVYVYNYTFQVPGTQLTPNFGFASAAALFFSCIMVVLTMLNYFFIRRFGKREA